MSGPKRYERKAEWDSALWQAQNASSLVSLEAAEGREGLAKRDACSSECLSGGLGHSSGSRLTKQCELYLLKQQQNKVKSTSLALGVGKVAWENQ